MGVEYRHYLIPDPRDLRPDANQLHRLIAELEAGSWIRTPRSPRFAEMEDWNISSLTRRTGGFVVRSDLSDAELPATLTPEWIATHIADDVQFVWEVGSLARSGLRYPLMPKPEGMTDEDIYYQLSIDVSRDYVYRTTECIQPFESTRCRCGSELELRSPARIFFSSRLFTRCPACSTPFDPSDRTSVIVDGWTGEERELSGGATSRFALVVDCGKAIPYSGRAIPRDSTVLAEPDLVDLIARCLECSVEQVGTIT